MTDTFDSSDELQTVTDYEIVEDDEDYEDDDDNGSDDGILYGSQLRLIDPVDDDDIKDDMDEARDRYKEDSTPTFGPDVSEIFEATFLYMVIVNRFDEEAADIFWMSTIKDRALLLNLKECIDDDGFLTDAQGKVVHTAIHIEHKLPDKSSGIQCSINQY